MTILFSYIHQQFERFPSVPLRSEAHYVQTHSKRSKQRTFTGTLNLADCTRDAATRWKDTCGLERKRKLATSQCRRGVWAANTLHWAKPALTWHQHQPPVGPSFVTSHYRADPGVRNCHRVDFSAPCQSVPRTSVLAHSFSTILHPIQACLWGYSRTFPARCKINI